MDGEKKEMTDADAVGSHSVPSLSYSVPPVPAPTSPQSLADGAQAVPLPPAPLPPAPLPLSPQSLAPESQAEPLPPAIKSQPSIASSQHIDDHFPEPMELEQTQANEISEDETRYVMVQGKKPAAQSFSQVSFFVNEELERLLIVCFRVIIRPHQLLHQQRKCQKNLKI